VNDWPDWSGQHIYVQTPDVGHVWVQPLEGQFRGDYNFHPNPDRFPPQQWHQEDPADSLYRAAHSFFSRQEYRPAAERYATLRSRYPTSRYFCDAAYFEAFSRHRLGTSTELRAGHAVLDAVGTRCSGTSTRQDFPQLTARINGALARLGDAAAAERLRRAASEGQNVCDREERDVKIEALNALAQMNPQEADPVLRAVLALKDECSAPVRQHAVGMVARRNTPESVTILSQVVKTDPDRNNQMQAITALGRMTTDGAYAALEEFFRTSSDERMQMAAVAAMGRNRDARAQNAVRALIERRDVAERVRLAAITALAENPNIAADYWRTLYTRVESDDLRRAVVFAAARNNGDESQQFLLSLARNQSEPYAAREAAVSRIRSTAPVAELYRLLESADSRSMRLSIVGGLSARKEPEATDRLIDIAKTSTDPEVRNAAIRALGQPARKSDPKVIKALAEIAGIRSL
jgi:HEAT repeat protein